MRAVYAAVLVSQLVIASMVALVAFVAGAAEQARQQVPAPVEPSISRCSSASEWYRVSVSPGVIWAQCTCEEQVNS